MRVADLRIRVDSLRQLQERRMAAVILILQVENPINNIIMKPNLKYNNSQLRSNNNNINPPLPERLAEEVLIPPTITSHPVSIVLHLHPLHLHLFHQ